MVKISKIKNFLQIKYVAPAVASLTLIVAAACGGDEPDTISPNPISPNPTSGIEGVVQNEIITYDMAKHDESLRQGYLDQVFINRSKYGDDAWDAFAKLNYDPEFNLLASVYGGEGLDQEQQRINAFANEDFIPLMVVLFSGEYGVPLDVYVSKEAFEVTKLEGEFFSILDNESVNADVFKSGVFPLIDLEEDLDLSSTYVFDLAIEVLSFEKEFYNIEIGRRKVTPDFLKGGITPAKLAYKELLQFSRMDNDDGKFAKAVIDAIEFRPTLEYFK